jgi:hypothetical protein
MMEMSWVLIFGILNKQFHCKRKTLVQSQNFFKIDSLKMSTFNVYQIKT